jgi:Methylase involved in ubiquinone/menaquinone biosynthesis
MIMSNLLNEIQTYWGQRAESFSEDVLKEDESRWMETILAEIPEGGDVLDIGTGPGFFAIALAKKGYNVTAVDYTPEMLEKAMENSGGLREKIDFLQMDAQNLSFSDSAFDVIVTRNLTWNLEHPDVAYKEWRRVLKPGGVMLNFDASWYGYLNEEDKAQSSFEAGGNYKKKYENAKIMEDISKKLVLSRCDRPLADLQLLIEAGFSKITIDTEVWKRVWSPAEQLFYASTPCFMIKAK